jgi:HEAT repeat protein
MEDRRKALINLLKDPREEVRRSAAEALERLEGLSNFTSLVEKYRTADKPTRLKVIYAFGKIRADGCLPILIHALRSDDEDTRAAAVRVLGEIADPKSLQPLIALLKDPSPTIQTLVVESLAGFRHQGIAPHLLPLIQHENKHMVIAALNTLGALNATEAIGPIIALTTHRDPDIRKTAAEVLGRIEG